MPVYYNINDNFNSWISWLFAMMVFVVLIRHAGRFFAWMMDRLYDYILRLIS